MRTIRFNNHSNSVTIINNTDRVARFAIENHPNTSPIMFVPQFSPSVEVERFDLKTKKQPAATV